MATLHIVRQSAFSTNDFFQCTQVLGNNDSIVFVDDGCYNLQHDLINSIDSDKHISLLIMSDHAQARAVAIDDQVCTEISMADLVTLTFEKDRVITWQ